MFKYINNDLPDVFKSMFSYRHEIHAYNTRGANQLNLEQFPTNIGLKKLRYFGAKLWNNIFLSFTDINCVDLFNARFKGMLLDSKFFGREHDILYMRTKIITVSWCMNIIIITRWALSKHKKNCNWMWILLTAHLFILSSKCLKEHKIIWDS